MLPKGCSTKWLVGQPDHFKAAMSFTFLVSLAEIDLGELEINPQRLKKSGRMR
jgi:hypothetical protein